MNTSQRLSRSLHFEHLEGRALLAAIISSSFDFQTRLHLDGHYINKSGGSITGGIYPIDFIAIYSPTNVPTFSSGNRSKSFTDHQDIGNFIPPHFLIGSSSVSMAAEVDQSVSVSERQLQSGATEYRLTVSRSASVLAWKDPVIPLVPDVSYPSYYYFLQSTFGTIHTVVHWTLNVRFPPGEVVVSDTFNVGNGGNFIAGDISEDSLTYDGKIKYDFERVIVVIKKAVVSSVDFAGIGFATIHPDPGSSNPFFDPAQKDYVDSNQDGMPEQRHPLLYAAGGIPVVNATFKMPAGSTGQYLVQGVQGTGADQFVFEGMGSINDGTLAVSGMQAKTAPGAALPKTVGNLVRRYNDFAITWTLTSASVGSAPISGGTSRNTLYVSAAAPKTTQLYHSVVELATGAAQGVEATNRTEIIRRIWNDFADLEVARVDGQRLRYYGDPQTGAQSYTENRTTEQLLGGQSSWPAANGQCGSWVQLFLDVLAVNGVTGQHVTVEAADRKERLLVAKWSFVGAGSLFDERYSHLFGARTLVYTEVGGQFVVPSGPSSMPANEVLELDGGLGGQSTLDPISSFENHQVARVDGIYYDPSYGRSYGTSIEGMEEAIAGFARPISGKTPLFQQEAFLGVEVDGDAPGTVGYLADTFVLQGWAVREKDRNATGELQVVSSVPYPPALTPIAPAITLLGNASSSRVAESLAVDIPLEIAVALEELPKHLAVAASAMQGNAVASTTPHYIVFLHNNALYLFSEGSHPDHGHEPNQKSPMTYAQSQFETVLRRANVSNTSAENIAHVSPERIWSTTRVPMGAAIGDASRTTELQSIDDALTSLFAERIRGACSQNPLRNI